MISRVSLRNFLAIVALLQSSVSAFNPMNNKPNLPVTDITDGGLKAATIGNDDDSEDVWSSLTQMIHSKIEESGGDSLSEEAKDELIATAVAGSVVGTVVGSPMIVGAALGFAGSQMLQGENGEKAREVIGQASKDVMTQANAAIDFTKKELENEKDLSKVSKKILLAIQEKAGEMQKEFQAEELPGLMAEKMKESVLKTVNSDEFKSLPQRSMNAFAAFMESEDVQKMKAKAMQAIKDKQLEATKALQDGLESDEMKALQSRASKAVQDGIETASAKITKA